MTITEPQAETVESVIARVCDLVVEHATFARCVAADRLEKVAPRPGWPGPDEVFRRQFDLAIEAATAARGWAIAEEIVGQFRRRTEFLGVKGRAVPGRYTPPDFGLCQLLTRIAVATVATPGVMAVIDAEFAKAPR